jgi:hypothetical protein
MSGAQSQGMAIPEPIAWAKAARTSSGVESLSKVVTTV